MLCFISLNTLAQKQGIKGKVVWISGNQMPGPGKKLDKGKGIEREILVYKPVAVQNAKQKDGFFTEINETLVTRIKSKADGSFCVKLPVGEYSIFTKEPDGLFASIYDDQGRINVITVEKKKFSEITLQLNYEATY